MIVQVTLTSWRLNCWSPSLSPVLFPVVADPVPWNSDEFLSRLPSELRVSFPPCCPYAEVARVLFTLNFPICCWKGKTYLHKMKITIKWKKAKVKLICLWPGTAIQNRKRKNNMFMAENCHSKQKKVKLIFSWRGTALQHRKRKNNMFMAGNCRSQKMKNLRLLAGDSSLPRSRPGPAGNVPCPALRGSLRGCPRKNR